MFCHDFIKLFESQYPDFSWKEVEADIFKMLKKVFEGATSRPPPAGIGHCPQGEQKQWGRDLVHQVRR